MKSKIDKEKVFDVLFNNCPHTCASCGVPLVRILVPMYYEEQYEWDSKLQKYVYRGDTDASEQQDWLCTDCYGHISETEQNKLRPKMFKR